MILSELIERLEGMQEEVGGDADVMFSYQYGDHARSQVCEEPKYPESKIVKYSSYHSMYRIVEDDEEIEQVELEFSLEEEYPEGYHKVVTI